MKEHWSTDCIGGIDPAFIEEAGEFAPAKRKHRYFRKVLIKWAIIILGMAVLLTVLLLWPPRQYQLVKENGNYYMCIDSKYLFLSNAYGCTHIHAPREYIRFETVEDMERAIRRGNFTAKEFFELGRYANREQKIALFNIDDLMEAEFPEGFSHYVLFAPDYYMLCGERNDGDTKVALQPVDYQAFLKYIQRYSTFQDPGEISAAASNAHALRENITRNAYYDWEICYYVITADTAKYYVCEYYDPQSSTEIPVEIIVLCQQSDGACFHLHITNCTERPSIQWLTSFLVREHE